MKLLAWLVAIALLFWVGVAAQAQNGDLDVVQLRPNFYVIGGAGGNVVVQLGPEGVILVDSGSTERADQVLAAIRRLTDLPIRYIINTSMDADHTGGNEKLAKAGLSILPGAVVAGAGLDDDVVSNLAGPACWRMKTCWGACRLRLASSLPWHPGSGRPRRSLTTSTRCT